VNEPTEYIALSLMEGASVYRDGAEEILAEHDAIKRAEVLREISDRLANRATLYGDSRTVNQVMRDLERLADASAGGESR